MIGKLTQEQFDTFYKGSMVCAVYNRERKGVITGYVNAVDGVIIEYTEIDTGRGLADYLDNLEWETN